MLDLNLCLFAPCLPHLTPCSWNFKDSDKLPDSKYVPKLDPSHGEPSSQFLLLLLAPLLSLSDEAKKEPDLSTLCSHACWRVKGRQTLPTDTHTHTVPGACAMMESSTASGSGENSTVILAQFERALRLVVREIHVDVATFKRNVEQRLEEAYKGAKPLENMVSRLQEENQQLKEKLEALSHLVDTLPWIASQSSSQEKCNLHDLAPIQAQECSPGTASSMEEEENCDPAGTYLLGGSVCVDSDSSSSRSSPTASVGSTIIMDASYESNVSCLFLHCLLSLFEWGLILNKE